MTKSYPTSVKFKKSTREFIIHALKRFLLIFTRKNVNVNVNVMDSRIANITPPVIAQFFRNLFFNKYFRFFCIIVKGPDDWWNLPNHLTFKQSLVWKTIDLTHFSWYTKTTFTDMCSVLKLTIA